MRFSTTKGAKNKKTATHPTKELTVFTTRNTLKQYYYIIKGYYSQVKESEENMMNELTRTIISTEVAQMVDKRHADLLKDIRKYIEQLGEGKISPSDFFTESTYITEQNRVLPCYLVTKKGCEFIAHKLTGQKGTEFTARYINRFHEMENAMHQKISQDIPVGEIARLSVVMDRIMVRQESKPYEIAQAFETLCRQFGIVLPANFVKVPEYEQLTLRCVSEEY